jgi:Na+-driven multidrug efflux pump
MPLAFSSPLNLSIWPVLIAQLALMTNVVIDIAMAGRLSEIGLASSASPL